MCGDGCKVQFRYRKCNECEKAEVSQSGNDHVAEETE